MAWLLMQPWAEHGKVQAFRGCVNLWSRFSADLMKAERPLILVILRVMTSLMEVLAVAPSKVTDFYGLTPRPCH
jgi:hypothetical protein